MTAEERINYVATAKICQVITLSGRKSITEATSLVSTYEKKTKHLFLFLPHHRATLVNTLAKLARTELERVHKFNRVLGSLSDEQFEILVEASHCASESVFEKYLEILALLPLGSEECYQHRKTRCDCAFHSRIPSEEGCIVQTIKYDSFDPSLASASSGNGTPGRDTDIYLKFLAHSKEAACVPGSSSSESSDIMSRIHDLNSDVFQNIFDMWAKTVFVPGCVFPNQKPDKNGQYHCQGKTYNAPNPATFLALDRCLLEDCQRKLFEENQFVIGAGHQDNTVEFLWRIGDNAKRIKSVYLAFSIDDVLGASDMLSTIQRDMYRENGEASTDLDNIHILERFVTQCEVIGSKLLVTWWMKFFAITCLKLDHLTLDFTKAYGPDKTFLPGYEWLVTLPLFQYGVPKLDILAPTPELKAVIETAFDDLN